jgi:S-DNA-T family DNA segregation ATPase FtsK/SpoIIIE
LPTKTRSRPTRRATSYRPRSSSRRSHGIAHFPRLLPENRKPLIWAGFGILALLAVSVPFTAQYFVDAFEGILTLFGVLPLLVVATVAANGWLFYYRRPEIDRAFIRVWVGVHMAVVFAFGLAGFFTPSWTVGDVSFEEVTAGGNLGELMAGSPIGIVAWAGIGLTSAGLIWPPGAWYAWQGVCAVGRFVRSLEIPQNIWRGAVSFFTGLVPKEEGAEEVEEKPKKGKRATNGALPDRVIGESEAAEAVPIAHESQSDVLITSEHKEKPFKPKKQGPRGGWELPPIDLLATAADVEVRPVDNEIRARLIVETLGSFGVDAKVVSINQGPTVTQFGVEPGWEVKTKRVQVRDEDGKPIYDKDGRPVIQNEVISRTRVRVNKVTNLANDLALALAAPSIRIEAPVPGKPIIGIEVPNTTTSLVALRSVIESAAFQKANAISKLAIALGKGVSGEPVAADLTRMPHLLIAGATGSGKSVCINSIIGSFLLHNTPEELRLVLVDPKRVELAGFQRIPHLAFSHVIVDPDEIVGTLTAIIHEMDSRYRRFQNVGVRNLEAYNKHPRVSHKLPHWVVIIDELADLMMVAPYEVERQICRLAQLARATGIHLIIATQRPSVDVVTGLIKANFPTRIAFAVSSQVDSRTIIDMAGADKLLGRGDMLFMPTDAAKPKRLQGSYVSDDELEKIVDWWTNDRFRHLAPEKLDHLLDEAAEDEKDELADPLFNAAKELAVQHSRISTSLLQRRLHVGYPRAARLVDMLEEYGIVGPAEGGQSRIVLQAPATEHDEPEFDDIAAEEESEDEDVEEDIEDEEDEEAEEDSEDDEEEDVDEDEEEGEDEEYEEELDEEEEEEEEEEDDDEEEYEVEEEEDEEEEDEDEEDDDYEDDDEDEGDEEPDEDEQAPF